MRTARNANSRKGFFRYLVNNNFSGTPFLCSARLLFSNFQKQNIVT